MKRKSGSRRKTYVIIDEFGNTGDRRPHETKFGYGVSVTKHPRIFGSIAVFNRIIHNRGDELKANDTKLKNRLRVSKAISKTDVKTYAVYVDKDADLPNGWEKSKRSRMIGVLDATLDETLPKEGTIKVVVDNNNMYPKKRLPELIRSKSNEKRSVSGDQYDSRRGKYHNILQTNDYVANAARSDVELGFTERSRILKIVKKRLGLETELK